MLRTTRGIKKSLYAFRPLQYRKSKVEEPAANVDMQVTYQYPLSAAFRKPVTIFLGVMAVFVTAWAVGKLDISIGKAS